MIRGRWLALASLAFTALFFVEYTPWYNRVHIPFDLEGYHFPLSDYAFQAFRHGQFPLWDAANYCGYSFVGNIQAGLFYPPAWIMFLVSLPGQRLHYRALEYLVFAHYWLAFLFCCLWLYRQKRLHWLASVLGAGVFAFSGYLLLQLQHLGLVCGYAWIPLGFWSIDEAAERSSWRPLWKLALASAMCFLAGYTPTWVVFCVCMMAYAAGRRGGFRWAALGAGAIAASLLWSSTQLLPTLQATRTRNPEVKYAEFSGFRDPGFYLAYFIPNYDNFALGVDPQTNPGREYLYLGGAGLVGLAFWLVRRRFRDTASLLCVLGASLLFLVNPFELAGIIVARPPLSEVFIDWYFLAGVTAAIAPLAAFGLDFAFTRTRQGAKWPRAAVAICLGAACVWSTRLLIVWNHSFRAQPAAGFAIGWKSGIDALVGVAVFAALVGLFGHSSGRVRSLAAAGLIVVAVAEYKAFGTSRRFDALPGGKGPLYASGSFDGMNTHVFRLLCRHPEYREAVDSTGPLPQDLRHVGLSTPQGFDPFLPRHFKAFIDSHGGFRTNREFDLSPENETELRILGVRYFISSEQAALYARLLRNPHFRLLQPNDSYYKVFELADATPAYAWDAPAPGQSAEVRVWDRETRTLQVRSPNGGVFRLSEQFYPGWAATVDGVAAPIDRCHEAFQCVAVPPGEHIVRFHYRPRSLFYGALLSLFSITLSVAVLRRSRPRATENSGTFRAASA